MKKLQKLIVLAILLFSISIPASAHPGKTDENGGHTDHDTGEYHYHHGYPAHDHWDMDGDGDVDCPYFFDDKTGQNSGASGTGSGNGNGNSSSSDMYENGYEKGQEDGYNDGYDDGYLSGHKKGHDEGYDEGYSQAEADMAEKTQDKIERAYAAVIVGAIAVFVFLVIPISSHIYDQKIEKERKQHREEIAKVKQEKTDSDNLEILQAFAPGAEKHIPLPAGVRLQVKCIPIKGYASASRPYGDYTIYTSAKGSKYHFRKGCSGAETPVHLFCRKLNLTPCKNCELYSTESQTIPVWFEDISDSLVEIAAPQE